MTPIIGNVSPVGRAQDRSRSLSSLVAGCKGWRDMKDSGKRTSFLSDSLVQAITCGTVNGILLPPVLVSPSLSSCISSTPCLHVDSNV